MKKISFLMIFLVLIPGFVFGKDYVIGGGDSLQISVWGSPELSSGVSVRPDGKISIPAVGEIKASGLTPLELADVLKKEMSKVIKTPIVTVIVANWTNSQIFVFGNGVSPGARKLTKETTLLEFLSQLGDFQGADLEKAYIVRDKKIIKTNFHKLYIDGDYNDDMVLEPNDMLFIPDNFEKGIKVMGAVKGPTTLRYRAGLTILDVILAAGGFTEFAKQNDVLIIRNVEGKEIRTTARVKDIMNGEISGNIKIMPGDFILVKESFF